MAVLTCERLRSEFGLNLPVAKDAQWARLIDVAETACFGCLGFDPSGSAEKTEYFDAVGGDTIALRLYPVLEAEVWLNGSGGSWSESLGQSQFRLDKQTGVIRLYADNKAGVDSIKVRYRYGWEKDTVPADVLQCIALTVQYLVRLTQSGQIGITQRTADGGTESLEQSIPPLAVKAVLNTYRPGRIA